MSGAPVEKVEGERLSKWKKMIPGPKSDTRKQILHVQVDVQAWF